ncbi:hypothetical protein L596_012445 [Steinernema carpocapsae]|uniref:DUF4139 domain-containing protein n=1 Tax=Steinernema carpocapsae TaxID=34508 RepID=A0A4U5NX35_STECR|nr:hypothetical protein L596_012445 [Steinernema carpocapsae]
MARKTSLMKAPTKTALEPSAHIPFFDNSGDTEGFGYGSFCAFETAVSRHLLTSHVRQRSADIFSFPSFEFDSCGCSGAPAASGDRLQRPRSGEARIEDRLGAGLHELVIENAAQSIDQDSIRIEGTGHAQIQEVKFKDEHVVQEDIDSAEVKKLVEELKDVEKQRFELNDKKDSFKRQVDTLNVMANKIGCSEGGQTFVFTEDFESNLSNFFAFYDKRVTELHEQMRDVEDPLERLNKEHDKLNNKINELRNNRRFSRNILVSLEVLEESDMEFVLTYQVYGAYWRPTYDVRVVSAASTADKTALKMDYFAQVRQNTGEEWTDTSIVLSTAQPCLGGNVPELGTLNASFFKPPPPPEHYEAYRSMAPRPMMANAKSFMVSADMMESAPMVGAVSMRASQQVLSTEFEIPNKKSIPSDNTDHKMLITQIDFAPSLLHECVPKKSTNVFLTASVINSSEFPLLEGEAAVYLNHSFVAKTQVKSVAPGEKFTCSLGVDNAVKVTYKPAHKFNTESGMFNKQASVANTQLISIQNNKQTEGITIIVREHIPKATDEKIKVKVLSPTIEAQKPEQVARKMSVSTPVTGCTLNEDHNLEWTLQIKENEKKDLTVKWQIDYPAPRG